MSERSEWVKYTFSTLEEKFPISKRPGNVIGSLRNHDGDADYNID